MNPTDPTSPDAQPTELDELQDVWPPEGEPAESTEEEAALRREVATLHDQLLRRAAEFQNYRRRSESDRLEAERAGMRTVLMPMLEVFDDLRRSLEVAGSSLIGDDGREPGAGAFSVGVELVYQKFEDALVKLNVERIPSVGFPFDENLHEALMQQPAPDDTPSGTVIGELQPGYQTPGRVLRHARVVVAQ